MTLSLKDFGASTFTSGIQDRTQRLNLLRKVKMFIPILDPPARFRHTLRHELASSGRPQQACVRTVRKAISCIAHGWHQDRSSMSPTCQQPESHRTDLFSAFEGIGWSRPLESEGSENLGDAQREKASAFLKAATEKASKNGIELLFRGETRARLGERLCLNSSAALSKVASGLFYFGDKGKHFWKEDLCRRQEEIRTKWDTVVGSINDLSLKSFDGLLHHIDSILKLDKSQSFRAENVELCRIIENKSERTDLAKRFDGLSRTDKRWVRDLFIYIVHNFSRPDHKAYTPFVSTTPDFKHAELFTRKESACSDPCVICLFLCAKHTNRVFRSNGLPSYSIRLKGVGFPSITRLFFEENEVAFFGAVCPHFVFAIIDLNSKTAFWNPAVFDVTCDAGADVWSNGLPIDQKDFERHLGERTGYAKGIESGATGEREIRP